MNCKTPMDFNGGRISANKITNNINRPEYFFLLIDGLPKWYV